MALEKVLGFSIDLFKREPKVVLPNVLSWVPSALLTILILQGISVVSRLAGLESFQQVLTDTALLWEAMSTILVYIVIAIPIVIASVIIFFLLECAYCDIIRQAYAKKRVSLTKALSVAKSRLLSLVWTYTLEALIVILLFVGLLILGILGGIVGIVLALISGIVMILLASVFFCETPAVVVLENRSGLKAIKRSYSIARHNFWSLAAVILIVGIIVGVIDSALGQVPCVGFILSHLAGLFLNAWSFMTPAVFYYEYGKKGKT